MITIPEAVENIIKHAPFLEEAIMEDLINLSALARKIRPQLEKELMKDVTEGSIVMALKRLQPNLKRRLTVRYIFRKPPELIIRSGLFEVTIKNTTFSFEIQKLILAHMKDKQDSFFTMTHGVFESTIIASQELEHYIQSVIQTCELVSTIHDLSSITIKLPEENIEECGVYYSILKTIAWEGINFAEAVSTANEVTIILKNSDVNSAFQALQKSFDSGKVT